MKFTVDVQKDKGLVRGKVWPVDQKEPEAWTIEFEDPMPNREGAPALYGYAPGIVAGTEAFYNNVSVTPNKKGN
jgi:outer membrane protein assembly factor BamB